MSTPASDASVQPAPSTEVSSAPAAEPVAAEPVAAEPVAAEPAGFPSADDFGWDEWDGKADALPEQLRPWYDRFDGRYKAGSQELNDSVVGAQEEAEQYKRLYEALFSGEEDPRISEAETKAASVKHVYNEAQEQWKAEKENYAKSAQHQADVYFGLVSTIYKDVMGSLGEEGEAAIIQLMGNEDNGFKGYDLHESLEIYQLGPKAVEEALALAERGTDSELAVRLLKSEFKAEEEVAPAKEEPKRPAHSPAAKVVAGAGNAQSPTRMPKPNTPQSMRHARIEAVRRAMAKDRAGR